METRLEKKLERLRQVIRTLDSALIAYTGDIDSTFLLRVCRDELGEKAVAVTALSDSYPQEDLDMARHVATIIGARHITITHNDIVGALEDAGRIHHALKQLASALKLKHVVHSSHVEDADSEEFEAAKRAGAKLPLYETGFTQKDIEYISKELGIPIPKKKKKKAGASANRS